MNKYHKRFIESFTAENVIGIFSRYKGAAKEITESWGMLEAVKKVNIDIDNCRVFVIGDGCSPRTGVIFAYYTKADVVSIDPQFNLIHWGDHCYRQTMMGFPPERIEVVKDRVENLVLDGKDKEVVVIWPHSHAGMEKVKIVGCKNITHIAMPCCVPIPSEFMKIPHIVYDDYNIESPKRTIHIWKG